MRFPLRLFALVAFTGLAACQSDADRERARIAAQAAEGRALQEIVDAFTILTFKENPELATDLGVTETEAGGPFADRLSDLSKAGYDRLAAGQEEIAQRLRGIEEERLAPADRVTFDVLEATLKTMQAGSAFGYGIYASATPRPYVVSQLTGSYQSAPDFLESRHPLRNKADADAYLARLSAFAVQIRQETERLKEDAGRGVVPPSFILDLTLDQLRRAAGQPAPATSLVRSLQERAPAIEGVTPVMAADYFRRAIDAVRDEVTPALRDQILALESLRGKASSDPSVARLPDGADYYRVALNAWTTTEESPDAVFAMGERLAADYTKQMNAILDAQNIPAGSLTERMSAVRALPGQIYSNSPAGKELLLADLNRQVADMQARLPEVFAAVPKAALDVRRVPQATETGAPGAYYQGPDTKGTRPGVFYINLRDTAEWPRFMLPTLVYHEGAPGHHFQAALLAEQTEIPLLRASMLGFGGFDEGWGLYAEQLADEMGVYKNDPWGRLGYLQSMSFRAARLVVDAGLHAKGWSRQKAIDYLVETTGDNPSAMATEVDRYIVWPGQACSYAVGHQVIVAQREKARAALGDRFDLRAFHNHVLMDGATPLSVLEERTDRWIAEQKAKA